MLALLGPVDTRARVAGDLLARVPGTGAVMTGAVLLDDVHRFARRFVAFSSSDASAAVALWAAHTHLVDAFESSPRLALLSPEKQCGKSRTLELLELLCSGAETLSHASPAYLFRRIAADEPVTVLLDEADAIWRRGKTDDTAEALRSIVDAGHRKAGTVGRVEMIGQTAKLTRFPVFAPVALAGIGSLPDTILDRAVVVPMRRRAPDEHVDEYRARTTVPEGAELCRRLAAWAGAVRNRIGDPWPTMPPGVRDRPADVWEPLLAVADLAGGDWPERARGACAAFVTGSHDKTATIGVRLLDDLRGVFGDAEAVPTDTILEGLHKLDEAPWRNWYGHPLSARDLAKLLKPYGVSSTKVRSGEQSIRGYRRADLWDSWTRYGDPGAGSGTSGTSGTPLTRHVPGVPHVPDNPPGAAEGNLHHSSPSAGKPRTLDDETATRRCGLCSTPFVPDPPRRAVCDRCRSHLAGTPAADSDAGTS